MVTALAMPAIAQSDKINGIQQPLLNSESRPVKYVYSTEFLKDTASEDAIKYGLSPIQYSQMMATIFCESSWQIYPKPNHISWGVAQFTPPTWKEFGYGDIMNPISQLNVMSKMFHNHLEKRWDCWRQLFLK